MSSRQVIALAGAGDFSKYICEEILKSGRHDVIIISRAAKEWYTSRNIPCHVVTAYDKESILAILDNTSATTLISLVNPFEPEEFVAAQQAMLDACTASKTCKRFIPSEMGGDIAQYPDHPGYYVLTRKPIRPVLAAQQEVEYTLICNGWLGDYLAFLPGVHKEWKSYIRDIRPLWPIDVEGKTARLGADGNSKVTFTTCRDVSKALVALFDAPKWETYTYVSGETTTWNGVIDTLEQGLGIKIERQYSTIEQIEQEIAAHSNFTDPSFDPMVLATFEMDLANAIGAIACPEDKVKAHREKYFKGVNFRNVKQIIAESRALKEGEMI